MPDCRERKYVARLVDRPLRVIKRQEPGHARILGLLDFRLAAILLCVYRAATVGKEFQRELAAIRPADYPGELGGLMQWAEAGNWPPDNQELLPSLGLRGSTALTEPVQFLSRHSRSPSSVPAIGSVRLQSEHALHAVLALARALAERTQVEHDVVFVGDLDLKRSANL